MKSIVNRMVVVLMVGALTSVVAFAKVHKHTVTFDSDIKVNGTLVKKGTYQVKFDDETGQLLDPPEWQDNRPGNDQIEARAKKANDFVLRSINNGEETATDRRHLWWIDKDVMITNTGASTTGSSNN